MVAKDASPQAIGSCITYLRRYSLSAVVGIASEIDDDGNSATPAKGEKVEAQPIISLKDRVREMAKTKFKSPDDFKIWRVENNLAENLEIATEVQLSKIWAILREVKNAN